MTDSDKSKGGNMVIDEIGRKLIEEGSWTDDIQFEVFSDRVFRDLLAKIARDKIGKELHEVQEGFIRFLKDPATFEKLEQPVNNGLPLTDAVSDLFQKEYLPFVESSNDDQFVEDPDDEKFFNKDNIHATRLKNKISKLIRENKADDFVRKQWGNETNLELVYNHYCHLLSKNDEELLRKIKREAVERGKTIAEAIVEHFKTRYVLIGKDIKDRSFFFELLEVQSAPDKRDRRDEYVWKNRRKDFKRLIEEKLKGLFSPVSAIIKLDRLTSLMLDKFEVHFTGKNGKKGMAFIQEYAFEETFRDWSRKKSEEYISEQFEPVLNSILSVGPLHTVINTYVEEIDSTYFYKDRFSRLFQTLQVDIYVSKELKSKNVDLMYRHYCRLLLDGGLKGLLETINKRKDKYNGKLTVSSVIIPILQHFEETYISKVKTLKNEDKVLFFSLLGNQRKRDKFLWYDRIKDYKKRVNGNLKKVFDTFYLNISTKNDCDVIIEGSKTFFTGEGGLKFLYSYFGGNGKNVKKWSEKESERIIDERCKKYMDDNLASKLRGYYWLSKEEPRIKFRRMKRLAKDYILTRELDSKIQKKWNVEGKDTPLIYDHYFYSLVNGRINNAHHKIRVSFENVLKEFKDNKSRKQSYKKALKESFIKDFEDYLDVGQKRMKDEETRRLLFHLMKSKSARDHFLWTKSWKEYQKDIKDAVLDAYNLLVFPNGFNYKGKGFCPQLKEIARTLIKTKAGFRSLLTEDGGWAFVMNYSFKKNIAEWRDGIIKNYIIEKPRMIILLQADMFALDAYLEQDEKLRKNFSKLYNHYSDLDGRYKLFKEKGEQSKDSFYKKREKVTTLKDAIRDFITYFYDWKSGTGNTVRRCEKEFEDFRFESQLSTWLYSTCENYFNRRIKKEYDDWEKKGNLPSIQKEILEVLGIVLEVEPLLEPVGKDNKKRIVTFYSELVKKEFEKSKDQSTIPTDEKKNKTKKEDDQPTIPTDEEIRKALKKAPWKKLGLKPNQDLGAKIRYEDKIQNLNILINSVLVNYAWMFFGFRKDDFGNTNTMCESFKKLGINWKFFDDRVVEFEIEDITNDKGEIIVLPKLLALCHIQYFWYLKNDVDDRERYALLENFYGMDNDLMRHWKSKSTTEFLEKVWPFVDKFVDIFKDCKENVPELYFILLPAFLSLISDYFKKNKKRDCLNVNKKGLEKMDNPSNLQLANQSDADTLLANLKSLYGGNKLSVEELEDYYDELINILEKKRNTKKVTSNSWRIYRESLNCRLEYRMADMKKAKSLMLSAKRNANNQNNQNKK